ncbi:MAG: hypothetical protein ACOY4K_15845 [Pseudomonadota bacterium]
MSNEGGPEALRPLQRLVFRCAMDFLLDETSRLARRHDGDLVRATILLAIAQVARCRRGAEAGADGPPRAISVKALSQSLGVPYETTRRKVMELETLGLCRRAGAAGVTATPLALDGAAGREDAEAAWLNLRRSIAGLGALGFDLDQLDCGPAVLAAAPDDAAFRGRVEALVGDFLLRLTETAATIYGSRFDALLAVGMLTLNARPLIHDPALAWRYAGAETPPPDALRRPVTAVQLSERLGVAYEAVRRRANRFVRIGWAARVPGGYLFSMARQQAPEVLHSGLLASQRYLQLLRAVGRLAAESDPSRRSPRPGATG